MSIHQHVLDQEMKRQRISAGTKILRLFLVASGLLPIVGLLTSHDATLLIYTLFAIALLNRQSLTVLFRRIRLPGGVKFALAILMSGWLTECFVWLGSYLMRAKNPAMLHPQLLPDLLLAIGFYGGWAVAWLLVLRRWRFTLTQVFFTTGLLGIGIEQDGAVLAGIAANLANPLAAAILALYVLAVYGSIMGLPYLLAEPDLVRAEQRTGWLKYLVVLIGMFLGAKIFFLLIAVIAQALHLIPPHQPIWSHPFF